jgi:hypothetical protein
MCAKLSPNDSLSQLRPKPRAGENTIGGHERHQSFASRLQDQRGIMVLPPNLMKNENRANFAPPFRCENNLQLYSHSVSKDRMAAQEPVLLAVLGSGSDEKRTEQFCKK